MVTEHQYSSFSEFGKKDLVEAVKYLCRKRHIFGFFKSMKKMLRLIKSRNIHVAPGFQLKFFPQNLTSFIALKSSVYQSRFLT